MKKQTKELLRIVGWAIGFVALALLIYGIIQGA